MKHIYFMIAALFIGTASIAAETATESNANLYRTVCTVELVNPNGTVAQRFVQYNVSRDWCIQYNANMARQYRMRAVWHYQAY